MKQKVSNGVLEVNSITHQVDLFCVAEYRIQQPKSTHHFPGQVHIHPHILLGLET
jgi:hypothetical protein